MEAICCQERGGCGDKFALARPHQKACGRRCASRMIGQLTEELRIARRQRFAELAGPVGAPGTGLENKRRKARKRRQAKSNARKQQRS